MHHETSTEVAQYVHRMHPETKAAVLRQLAQLTETFARPGKYQMRKGPGQMEPGGWQKPLGTAAMLPTYVVRAVFGRLTYEVEVTETEAIALHCNAAHLVGQSAGRGRRVVRVVAGAASW